MRGDIAITIGGIIIQIHVERTGISGIIRITTEMSDTKRQRVKIPNVATLS